MKHIHGAAAILVFDGRILCMLKSDSPYAYIRNRYEFPGGKIEAGESPVEAVRRELKEELAIELPITEDNAYMVVDYTYPDFSLTLHMYKINITDTHFTMKEHSGFIWLVPDKLKHVSWPDADAAVIERLSQEKV